MDLRVRRTGRWSGGTTFSWKGHREGPGVDVAVTGGEEGVVEEKEDAEGMEWCE